MSLLLKSEAYLNNKMDELDELILKLILKWMLVVAMTTTLYGCSCVNRSIWGACRPLTSRQQVWWTAPERWS